jgi:hypothetical protein
MCRRALPAQSKVGTVRRARAGEQKTAKLPPSLVALAVIALSSPASAQTVDLIGKEIAIPAHLQDGRELEASIQELIAFGEKLFSARWTSQEGQGRPLSKGTGSPLADPSSPLVFPKNFDRMSGPDANSCAGCHNTPFVGGGVIASARFSYSASGLIF